MSKGSGDSRRFESKQSLLFPTGLNLLESKTQKLIKGNVFDFKLEFGNP